MPGSKNGWRAFVENMHVVGDFLFAGDVEQPTRRFVHGLEGQFERAVMHRDELMGAKVFEGAYGFIRSHVDVAE